MENHKRRVKVYELNSDGQWIDMGTGQVSNQYVEAKEGYCLVVKSETENTLLLNSKIRKDDVYHRQQETLIVWTEPNGTDLALSFQDPVGCTEVWNQIVDVQNRLARSEGGDIDQLPSMNDDEPLDDYRSDLPFALPSPTLGNLKEIELIFLSSSKTAYGKGQLAGLISREGYLPKLLPLLEMCEDMESTEDLYSLSTIMRIIIFLNDAKNYDLILEEDVFAIVVGMLEYDREFPNAKANHREHITKRATFKQVIPIPDPAIVDKIKRTYRLQFLKDVALARLLDDQTFTNINSLIFFNHVDIVSYFQQNDEFLSELFSILTSEDSNGKKKDVVLFLHELANIAKSLQPATRTGFFRAMGQYGLFTVFEYTLADTDLSVRLAAASILSSILDHDPTMVRSFCLAQIKQNAKPLVHFLISRFLEEGDLGLRSQIADIVRVLLDTLNFDTAEGLVAHAPSDPEGDEFLTVFYEQFMEKLMTPILSLETSMIKIVGDVQILDLDEATSSSCNYACELLCFIIKQHSYRSKYFILGSQVMSKLLILFKARESHIRLSALRVLRTCIGVKDEFYNRHLLKNDVFGPVLTAYRETGGRYNLLNSACLEFFEFIRKENVKSLISSLVQHHKSTLDSYNSIETFKLLLLRHEQNQEPISNSEAAEPDTRQSEVRRRGDGWGRLDNDEEAYFNTSDEEDEGTAAQKGPPPLSISKSNSMSPPLQPQGSFDLLDHRKPMPISPTALTAGSSPNEMRLVQYPDDDEAEDNTTENQLQLPIASSNAAGNSTNSHTDVLTHSSNNTTTTARTVAFSLKSTTGKRTGVDLSDDSDDMSKRTRVG